MFKINTLKKVWFIYRTNNGIRYLLKKIIQKLLNTKETIIVKTKVSALKEEDVKTKVNALKEEGYYYIQTSLYNNPEIETLRVKESKDKSVSLPFCSECDIKFQKIAVILHIYYTEMSFEIQKYLKNIPITADLFISTNTNDKKIEIEKLFSKYKNGTVVVKVFENKGRDIAPMIVGFKEVFEKYDIFLHLHSKKSPHDEDNLKNWKNYLFETLLGSEEIAKSYLSMLSNEKVGIIFPQYMSSMRESINWGYNFLSTQDTLARAGIEISSNQLLEFPAGSMFWGNSKSIKKLLDLELEFQDFPKEEFQIDGTLAHSIERSFLFFCESSGYRWLKTSIQEFTDNDSLCINVKNSVVSEEIINKVYRPLFNNYHLDNRTLKYPIREYKLYPSYITKPRLNILIPTINPHQTYGGVATAMKFFNSLQESLGNHYDYRIIVDNMITDEAKEKFSNYKFKNTLGNDTEQYEIVETVDNIDIHLRKNDMFIATIWWTAHSAYHLLDNQRRYFNNNLKFIYFIQDYESGFSKWSTEWAIIENTYKKLNKTIPIFNSEELAAFMLDRFEVESGYYIPYQLNETLAKKIDLNRPRKKQIIIYGRPLTERNVFEILIDGLYQWQKKNPIESKEWNIYSLGEEYSEQLVSHIDNITIMGKVSLEEYAIFLSESTVGISLMISPHPSYPPLEMASAGIKTISNTFDGKYLEKRSKNITSIDILSPENLAKTIELIIREENINNVGGAILDLNLNSDKIEKYDMDKIVYLLKGMNK